MHCSKSQCSRIWVEEGRKLFQQPLGASRSFWVAQEAQSIIKQCRVVLYKNFMFPICFLFGWQHWRVGSSRWVVRECRIMSAGNTVYSVQLCVETIQGTVYSVQCTLYTVHCILYSVHCFLYSVQGAHLTGISVHSPFRRYGLGWITRIFAGLGEIGWLWLTQSQAAWSSCQL